MNPVVSIVIPVYNGENYIADSIRSIQSQTYQELEVIYVDDGSKDATAAMLDEAAAKDARLHVIHKVNQGVSAARNTGIEAAGGDYIAFFDVDDRIEPDTIRDNVELALRHQADVVMFGFWYYNVDTGVEEANALSDSFAGSDTEYFQKYLAVTVDREYFNAPWNKVIRRALVTEHQLRFDTRYSLYEDNLFEADLMNVAHRIVINPQPYYHYYIKSSGSLLTKFHEDIFEGLSLFYDKTMAYCGRYSDNAQQCKAFDTMYVTHTYTYLKQISCNRELSREKQYALMAEVCCRQQLCNALGNVELKGRKWLIGYLIRRRRYGMIIWLYRLIDGMQQPNRR